MDNYTKCKIKEEIWIEVLENVTWFQISRHHQYQIILYRFNMNMLYELAHEVLVILPW